MEIFTKPPPPSKNNHEKVDTLMVLHVVHANDVNPGMQVVIYSPDTNILVIYVLRHIQFPKEHISALHPTDVLKYETFKMPLHSIDV